MYSRVTMSHSLHSSSLNLRPAQHRHPSLCVVVCGVCGMCVWCATTNSPTRPSASAAPPMLPVLQRTQMHTNTCGGGVICGCSAPGCVCVVGVGGT